jgi:hypothetical protein
MRRMLIVIVLSLLEIFGARAPFRTVQPERVSVSIDVVVGGPAIMAAGDTLSLAVRRYRCIGDVCDLIGPHAGRIEWTTSAPRVATVDARGVARGRSAGRARITARSTSGVSSVDVRVVPPVRDLAWTSLPAELRVGDTIAVAVLARGAGGQIVARLVPVAHIRGTGASGEVLWPPSDIEVPATRVYLDRPGLLVLVGRLADRVDTLRRNVRAR